MASTALGNGEIPSNKRGGLKSLTRLYRTDISQDRLYYRIQKHLKILFACLLYRIQMFLMGTMIGAGD